MCVTTTNKKAEIILSACRKIDSEGFKGFNDQSLADIFIKIKDISKEIESFEKLVKTELEVRSIPVIQVPDEERKVESVQANSKTEYNIGKLYSDSLAKNHIQNFLSSISFVASKAKELSEFSKFEEEVIKPNSTIVESTEKTVRIKKMTKQELLECVKA